MSVDIGTIRIDLTKESINAALKQIKQVQKDLKNALNNTVQTLGERGEVAAKTWLYTGPQAIDEPDYSEVEATIHYEPLGKGKARVYSDSDQAAFLEYGTGMVGSIIPHPGLQSGESTPPVLRHELANGEVHMYTAYDTYKHGLNGWNFWKDGKMYNTVGFPSRAFMYHALRDMETMAPDVMAAEIAKIHIGRWGG